MLLVTETGCGVGAGDARVVVVALIVVEGEARMLVIVLVGLVIAGVGVGAAPVVLTTDVKPEIELVVVGAALLVRWFGVAAETGCGVAAVAATLVAVDGEARMFVIALVGLVTTVLGVGVALLVLTTDINPLVADGALLFVRVDSWYVLVTETGCGAGVDAVATDVIVLVRVVGDVRMLVIVLVGLVATVVGEVLRIVPGVAAGVLVGELRLARAPVALLAAVFSELTS